jgi:signal transduction histidine kinase
VGAEVALAVVAGVVSFTTLAVALSAADSGVVAVLLALVTGAAVLTIARRWGAAYAIPVAVLGLVAYDWFEFPPTHPEEFPGGSDLLTLLAYLGIGTLAGALAAYGARRAETSESAREVLAGEQAALRRVATVVAQGASRDAVFEAIAREVARLVGVEEILMLRYEDDRHATIVARTRQQHDGFPIGSRHTLDGESLSARRLGLRSAVGTPIVVDGRRWGVLISGTRREGSLPADTEIRVSEFTDLMATAIANTEADRRADLLMDEQAALRRVATLVAKDAPPAEIFAKVAEEAAGLLGADCTLWRDDGEGSASVVAVHGTHAPAGFPAGTSITLEGDGVTEYVLREGRSRRVEDYAAETTGAAKGARQLGVASAVGHPVVVRGETWGAIVVAAFGDAEPCPPGTEARLAQFADLVATAIANADARGEVERLAEQQASLRRVAEIVARGSPQAEVFDAVAAECAQLFRTADIGMVRFREDTQLVLASSGSFAYAFPAGSSHPLGGDNASSRVYRTGRAARIDDYRVATGVIGEAARSVDVRSAVSMPITVEERLWGALTVGTTRDELLPAETEFRLGEFTELMAVAIANAEAQNRAARLTKAQAALRRVATLVAEGIAPADLFAAVTREVFGLFSDVEPTLVPSIIRFDPGPEFVLVGAAKPMPGLPVGSRWQPKELYVSTRVHRTGRSARVDRADVDAIPGPDADLLRRQGFLYQVGSPILVEGHLWGSLTMNSAHALPPDTGERLEKFAELLETAIANADSREQLAASRARLLTAADDARRRVVRDLHDGAQQRLVHSIVALKLAQRAVRADDGEAATLVDQALEQAEQGNAELRELAHGILPAALAHGGLRAGVDSVVARLDVPVHVDIVAGRFDAEIEASAYFIVAEALTNVMKHARAGHAEVHARVDDGALLLEVRDDGIGGADPAGHGLVGLGDRATALGGHLRVENPPDGGTILTAALPLSGAPAQ